MNAARIYLAAAALAAGLTVAAILIVAGSYAIAADLLPPAWWTSALITAEIALAASLTALAAAYAPFPVRRTTHQAVALAFEAEHPKDEGSIGTKVGIGVGAFLLVLFAVGLTVDTTPGSPTSDTVAVVQQDTSIDYDGAATCAATIQTKGPNLEPNGKPMIERFNACRRLNDASKQQASDMVALTR